MPNLETQLAPNSRPGLPIEIGAESSPAFADPMHVVLRAVMLTAAKEGHSTLTARQFAAFLLVYLNDEACTVRGVAKALRVSKPAVSRSFDRLCESHLIVRTQDPCDRRSVIAERTQTGAKFLAELRLATSPILTSFQVAHGNKLRPTQRRRGRPNRGVRAANDSR
jgi:DNA-binding MarR family transcriptional regulator